jgi:hypothetical protein
MRGLPRGYRCRRPRRTVEPKVTGAMKQPDARSSATQKPKATYLTTDSETPLGVSTIGALGFPESLKARDSGNPAVAKRLAGCRPYIRQPFYRLTSVCLQPAKIVLGFRRVSASTAIAPAAAKHSNRSPIVAIPDQMLTRQPVDDGASAQHQLQAATMRHHRTVQHRNRSRRG